MTEHVGSRIFSSVDLALFAAATWNPHLIHLDREAALRDGLPGTIVQSHFLPATLLALLDRQAPGAEDDPAHLALLHMVSWRNHAPVLAGDEVVFSLDTDADQQRTWTATVADKLVADGFVRWTRTGRSA